jgi:hypothetical protein
MKHVEEPWALARGAPLIEWAAHAENILSRHMGIDHGGLKNGMHQEVYDNTAVTYPVSRKCAG